MNKIYALAFIAAGLLAACNNSSDNKDLGKADPAPGITTADRELLQRAQETFQPLPAKAINAQNPITDAKVLLGKHLFYDTRLSKTGNNSCNSCHNLATFGVDNLPTSKGDNGGFGNRNSPTVLNAATHAFQFWDGRAKDVEEQAGGPILNPVEMAIPSKDFLITKLKGIKEYNDMFKAAFPTASDAVTYENVQNAIAAFERTLLTPSPFDKYLSGDHKALTSEQRIGMKTFMDAGCIQCHSVPIWVVPCFRSLVYLPTTVALRTAKPMTMAKLPSPNWLTIKMCSKCPACATLPKPTLTSTMAA
jgi:cytochrome c peroxidase